MAATLGRGADDCAALARPLWKTRIGRGPAGESTRTTPRMLAWEGTIMSTAGLSKTDDVLLVAAGDVGVTRAQLTGDLTALRARLEQLARRWEGRGHRAFQDAIDAWQQTADRVIGALDGFEAQLRASDDTYLSADDQVSGALSRYAGLLG
jgi:WXG100 family type VII secretion target